MQLTCPVCHARYALEAALNDDDARVAVAAAMKMPAPLGDLVLRYIGLFRPRKQALSWKRAAKLIRELAAMIDAAQVEYNGRPWPAPQTYWKRALEDMLNRRDQLTLPLTSHGYLIKIIVGTADKAEGKVEQQREESRRHRAPPAESPDRSDQGPKRAVDQIAPEKLERYRADLKGALKGGSNANE